MNRKKDKDPSTKMRNLKVAAAATACGLAAAGCLLDVDVLSLLGRGLSASTTTSAQSSLPEGVMIDDEGTCVNDRPYPTMHYPDHPDDIASFQKWLTEKMWGGRKMDRPPPEIHTLPAGTMFAHWDCPDDPSHCDHKRVADITHLRMSAWDPSSADDDDGPTGELVSSPFTWKRHRYYQDRARYRFGLSPSTPPTIVTGNVAFYVGFYYNNYGHVLHDSFPTLAYLRESLPTTTKFILPYDKSGRLERYLTFLAGADFVPERVLWARENEVFQVRDGTVSVAVTPDESTWTCRSSMMNNHILMPYLRRWIRESEVRGILPAIEAEEKEQRHVIFHTRLGTTPRRVLDADHERDVLAAVKAAMTRHGIDQPIKIFSGQDEQTGELLPLEEQYKLFRRASAVIGPHGSGLANLLWTDPYPADSCDGRTKLLEFIPMPDSEIVQMLYKGYYMWLGAMPIDYHVLGYAGNSTVDTTYIRMADLEEGLDAMWGGRRQSAPPTRTAVRKSR